MKMIPNLVKYVFMSPEKGQLLEQSLIPQKPSAVQPNELPLATTETYPPVIKKTPKMLMIEERFAQSGESIGDLLKRLYVDENKPLSTIHQDFRTSGDFTVSTATLRTWLAQLHPDIPIVRVREWMRNPQNEKYRVSRIRAAWLDPAKKATALRKIHTPQTDAQRSRSITEYFDKHPQEKAEFVRKSVDARRQKAAAVRMAALGQNPKETLKRMISFEGLNTEEIAKRLGQSDYIIRKWMKELGVKAEPRRGGLSIEEFETRRTMIKTAIKTGLFGRLTQRQQEILRSLYLTSRRPPPPIRVAERFGVERENIRQIDSRGLAKIQRLLGQKPENLKRRQKPGRPSLIDTNNVRLDNLELLGLN